MFDEQDKSCQRLADRCVIPVACMELQGMPIDADAHHAVIAQWEVDQRLALQALQKVSPSRDLTKPGPLRDHLQEMLPPSGTK